MIYTGVRWKILSKVLQNCLCCYACFSPTSWKRHFLCNIFNTLRTSELDGGIITTWPSLVSFSKLTGSVSTLVHLVASRSISWSLKFACHMLSTFLCTQKSFSSKVNFSAYLLIPLRTGKGHYQKNFAVGACCYWSEGTIELCIVGQKKYVDVLKDELSKSKEFVLIFYIMMLKIEKYVSLVPRVCFIEIRFLKGKNWYVIARVLYVESSLYRGVLWGFLKWKMRKNRISFVKLKCFLYQVFLIREFTLSAVVSLF